LPWLFSRAYYWHIVHLNKYLNFCIFDKYCDHGDCQLIPRKIDRPLNWEVERDLSVGYKTRSVARVIETILSKAGQITLLLGLNGQGKTTLMKTLAGLWKIWTVPPATSWPEIRKLLQQPKPVPA
jgi:hypothetical protein